MKIEIEITETEYRALTSVMENVNEWTTNALTNRANTAIEDIVKDTVTKCLEIGISIPSTKEDIVNLSFDKGWSVAVIDKVDSSELE